MENKRKSILAGTFVAGALISVAGLNANESKLFSYEELGSGSEIRTTLATKNIAEQAGILAWDAKCGEETKKSDKKEADSKSAEAKCGEGKCGEAKSDNETATKDADTKSDSKEESKSTEAKCGEGKCGN